VPCCVDKEASRGKRIDAARCAKYRKAAPRDPRRAQRHLATRRGKNRAAIMLAHALLISVFGEACLGEKRGGTFLVEGLRYTYPFRKCGVNANAIYQRKSHELENYRRSHYLLNIARKQK
jgi:hypothetical protein